MQKGSTRLVIFLAAFAVAVAGLLVLLSQLSGGGSQELLADIPQDGTRLGSEDAPVTIQLYEDFQCSACAQFARETLPEVIERYVEPGEAKIVSETLAFLGPDSVSMARATLAAGEQDRYWQYAFLLFENQGQQNSGYAIDEFLTNLAEETEGLDVGEWDGARDTDPIEQELEAAVDRGEEDGVEGTPTLIITGPEGTEKLVGAAPMEEVEAAVEEVRGQ